MCSTENRLRFLACPPFPSQGIMPETRMPVGLKKRSRPISVKLFLYHDSSGGRCRRIRV